MYRFAFLLALPACTLTTTHSTSPSGAYPRPAPATTTTTTAPPPGTGQNAPVLDERARLYEKAALADEPARPLDPTPRDCSVRANHCMRGGWMISTGVVSGYTRSPAVPVARRDGAWIPYDGTLPDNGIAAYRTAPATAAQLADLRRAFVLVPDGADGWPRSEAEMLASRRWFEVQVRDVDAAAGTFRAEELGTLPIGSARVRVETRSLR